MQEMTIETALTLLAILTPLNIFLWRHLGTYQLHSKPKNKSWGKKIPDPLKTSATGLIFNHRADITTKRGELMTQAKLEQIFEQLAETILEHTTPEEMKEYLSMDREKQWSWVIHKIDSLWVIHKIDSLEAQE